MPVPCDRCGKADLLQVVNMQVLVPLGWTNLSKKGIRSSEVKVLGADWPKAVIYCPNCGVYREGEDGQGTG